MEESIAAERAGDTEAPGFPERYVAALLAGDRRGAFAVVDEALASGMQLRGVYLEIFQPALREVGRLWESNRITVADEHLATAITQGAMARLYERLFEAAEAGERLLIAACADAERHEVGLRMLCDVLEMEGWDTVFLGPTVPIPDLVKMVAAREPDVVALSASIGPHLPRVRAAVEALRAALGERAPLIAVGGRAFHDDPELAARIGADFTAKDAVDAARQLKERFP
jgi:methanogenic corrinoid protein MtbC1